LLICGGLAVVIYSINRPQPNWWHVSFYIAATIGLAVRFFAARVVAVGFIVTAIALSLANWRAGGALLWTVWALSPALLLLASRDLRERFDRAEGSGWRTNPWRAIERRHWMLWCWVGYLLGILANVYLLPWMHWGYEGLWPLAMVGGVYVAIGLLFLGRVLAFFAAAAVGLGALATSIPVLAGSDPGLFLTHPGFVLPAVIAGALVVALSLPYALVCLARAR